jgi:hypothetical protein
VGNLIPPAQRRRIIPFPVLDSKLNADALSLGVAVSV